MLQRANVDFVFFDAGGGHRSAATALECAIESCGYPWNVRLVNLQEVLDPLDVFRKYTGIRLQDLYNRMLARGWTFGSSVFIPVIQFIIRRYHRPSVNLLADFWRQRQPDMVVSLIPNLNRAAFEGLQKVNPQAPYVTIMTDLADYPPHFWMERQRLLQEVPRQRQHIVCGTDRAYRQAQQQGYPPSHIHRASGMILRPPFYRPAATDSHVGRTELGLDPETPTALVMFGGEGSNVMYRVAKRLGNSTLPLQLIFVCGRNELLRERLNRMKTRNKMVSLGFTKEIPRFMALSDFFIGKPGPGSISEALQMRLPVIVESNAWTLPQEKYNTVWLKQKGYGIVLRNLSEVERAVQWLLENGGLAEMKRTVAAYENRALFEIPLILRQILSESSPAHSAPEASSAVPLAASRESAPD